MGLTSERFVLRLSHHLRVKLPELCFKLMIMLLDVGERAGQRIEARAAAGHALQHPGDERQFGVALQPAFRPQVAVQVLKARRRERQKRFDLAAGFLGKLVQVA